ncbi:hypothetical protein AVEN_215708-1 [Araneus ventricosus]|uniref:Uncharacterized protein n=1 Tax=Araneus ventricosus TaxID=182803 RepID=A0A4Y2GSK8_ARAVE|nr:hypothetical protein AVEN_215708-1 [Araneus ventricosus]
MRICLFTFSETVFFFLILLIRSMRSFAFITSNMKSGRLSRSSYIRATQSSRCCGVAETVTSQNRFKREKTTTPLFAARWRCNRSHDVAHGHLAIPRYHLWQYLSPFSS